MKDQAEFLRNRVRRLKKGTHSKVIAVVSGKGGVGKSNFSLNFSIGMSKKGYKILLLDMDIGMGNINILMGSSPEYTIADYFSKEVTLRSIISEGPEQLSYIGGGSGLTDIFNMDESMFEKFSLEFQSIIEEYDFAILDMGAGLSDSSLMLLLSADELFVVTTPEPTSIMDAYSIMKFITLKKDDLPYFLICNRAYSDREGKETIEKIKNVMQRFLRKEITSLGVLPYDKAIPQAVSNQVPFLLNNPSSAVSRSMRNMIQHYQEGSPSEHNQRPQIPFMKKLKSLLFER